MRRILKEEMVSLLDIPSKPAGPVSANGMQVILLVGVNGSGKTTSIAKLAAVYRSEGRRVLLGAADTFRAAAIDQLKMWVIAWVWMWLLTSLERTPVP